MATFKHISSKNADYGATEQYLTFEHDEFTMKPTLDESGRLMLREDYRIATLNCGGEDFAVACMRSNLRYGKNQKREDVKSHHYIISFDPRDAVDNGLTVDRAQALGEEFCRKQFPGHQAIVCTHPDGHNHSGNIHVHIELEKEGELKGQAPARRYGRYNNVFLSDTELDELKAELPDKWEYYIDRLSTHIASKGTKYRSHAATIYKWAQEDEAKKPPKKGIPDYTFKEGESL